MELLINIKQFKTNIKAGIYKITNIKNNKFYIGSSCNKKGLITRLKTHLYSLKRGDHYNKYLQKSWDKYGEESFIFEILEECDKDILIQREQFYIDTLKPNYNNCKIANIPGSRIITLEGRKNQSDAAKLKYKNNPELAKTISLANKGKVFSEETKQKMSITRLKKNIKLSEEDKLRLFNAVAKPIVQYDIEGNFIKEWKSISEAGLANNIADMCIINSIKRLGISANSQWRYKTPNYSLKIDSKIKLPTPTIISEIHYTLEDKVIIFNTYKECYTYLKIGRRTLYSHINNKIKNKKYNLKIVTYERY